MAQRKSAPLSSHLLVRKGQAVPATGDKPRVANDPTPAPSRGTKAIALTVKVDPERYHKLVAYGARFTPRRTNQDIVVAAIDAYLAMQE